MAYWRVETHPKILETKIGMTVKFLSDVGIYKEAQKQKKICYNLSGLYIKEQSWFLEM